MAGLGSICAERPHVKDEFSRLARIDPSRNDAAFNTVFTSQGAGSRTLT